MYGALFNKIGNIAAIADNRVENWVSLFMSGNFQQRYSKSIFSELDEVLHGMGKAGYVNYSVNNSRVSIGELEEFLKEGDNWMVNINKLAFMGSDVEVANFFYDVGAFRQWASQTYPFSADNPFNNYRSKIEVNGLLSSFGGPNFLVSGNVGDIPEDKLLRYNQDYLRSVLRLYSDKKRVVHPEKHYVSFGDVDENSYPFYRNSLMCLSVALCDEMYEDKVVLRGIRMLEFGLESPKYEKVQMENAQESLREAFCWIYADNDKRYELRHKLLMDRLSLDLPQNQSYYEGIISLISHASRQAAERYNYAFFERSNEYQQELQRFLKELHGLCDSYSSKVRSLLGSFLRDALAGFLTVAITLFVRVRDLEKLDSGKVLSYVFYAYAAYLLISCISQVFIDWRDLYLSEKEIDYWKTVSRDYMKDSDFEEHKRGTIRERKISAICQYAIIGFLYLGLACFSIKVPNLWEKLAKPEIKNELQKEASKNEEAIQNTLSLESLQDGKDTIPGNSDTSMYYTLGGK